MLRNKVRCAGNAARRRSAHSATRSASRSIASHASAAAITRVALLSSEWRLRSNASYPIEAPSSAATIGCRARFSQSPLKHSSSWRRWFSRVRSLALLPRSSRRLRAAISSSNALTMESSRKGFCTTRETSPWLIACITTGRSSTPDMSNRRQRGWMSRSWLRNSRPSEGAIW